MTLVVDFSVGHCR